MMGTPSNKQNVCGLDGSRALVSTKMFKIGPFELISVVLVSNIFTFFTSLRLSVILGAIVH